MQNSPLLTVGVPRDLIRFNCYECRRWSILVKMRNIAAQNGFLENSGSFRRGQKAAADWQSCTICKHNHGFTTVASATIVLAADISPCISRSVSFKLLSSTSNTFVLRILA
ncbi:MAG: hypothetical protein V3V13_06040 [Paracoccaceae bacterium]